MKDLRHYISKKRSPDRQYLSPDIERGDPTTWQFLSYCVYNSFKNEVNRIDGLIQLAESGEYFNLSFDERDMYMLEDFDIPTDFVRETILNALLLDYSFRDYYFRIGDESDYFGDGEFDFEKEKREEISGLKTFLKSNHLPNRECVKFVKENVSERTSLYVFVIRSKYLKCIYTDLELRNLFEKALSVDFVSPNCVLLLTITYNDSGFEEDQVDTKKVIEFIEACKRNFSKWKRKHEYNFAFADQLFYLDEGDLPMRSLIDGILNTYESLTEVMF